LRIQKISNNTYNKLLSPVEQRLLDLIRQEETARQNSDNAILDQLEIILQVLAGLTDSLGDVATRIDGLTSQIEDINGRLDNLENRVDNISTGQEVYTQNEIDQLLVPYKIEEIDCIYQRPFNQLFDEAERGKIREGYAHFYGARLKEDGTVTYPQNTMRRYTINCYFSWPKNIVLPVTYNDYTVIYLNETEIAALVGEGTVSIVVPFTTGWNKIQVLVASRQGARVLDLGVNLAVESDKLSCLVPDASLINGKDIIPYTVVPDALDPTGFYNMKRLTLLEANKVSLSCGDKDYGAVDIGDCTVDYSQEWLTVHKNLRVLGKLMWDQNQATDDEEYPDGIFGNGVAFIWEGRDIGIAPGYAVEAPNNKSKEVWRIDAGVENVFTDGPNLKLRPGKYTLCWRIKAEQALDGDLAYMEISTDETGILVTRKIIGADFVTDNRYAFLSVPFEYDGGRIKFRLSSTGKTMLDLDYVYLILGDVS
jgi:hypothetical protein